MRNRKQIAAGMAAVLVSSMLSGTAAMAANAIKIDMTDYNDEAWAGIAMANDDTVESGVNIRSGADINSSVAGFLYRGGAVQVLDKGAEWTYVQSGSVTGYIRNEYLVYGPEAKGLAEHYGSYGAKASWNDVNVFAGQSGSSRIVDTASDGDTYRLVAKDGDWMALQAGADGLAYVPAEDVSVVMVVDTAVPRDGEVSDSSGSFKEIASVPSAETADYNAQGGSPAAEADADTQETQEASYEEPSYTEYAEQSYETPESEASSYTDDGSSYETAAAQEQSYEEPSYSESGASTVQAQSGSGDLQATASALYQEYLTAQAAADAAVANGSGEQAIVDTAAAAVAAYGKYVAAQNAADEASWGAAAETAPSQPEANTGSMESQSFDQEESQAQPETQAETQPETQAPQTESTQPQDASASASDLTLLAALIYCEAGNQPYEGQVAVGAVVMNRIASGSFPNNIHDVIYQSGQFTPAYTGVLESALASGAGSGYIQAATDALNGVDPTGGALYFNVHQGSGTKIGAHWFF